MADAREEAFEVAAMESGVSDAPAVSHPSADLGLPCFSDLGRHVQPWLPFVPLI